MNVSLFQAASALEANSRWQEAIANNLASGSVPGYKGEQLSQDAVQAGLMSARGDKNLPQYFSIPRSSTSTNFAPGELKYTGDNTDVAIEGKGFFQVRLPDGSQALTRDGEFQRSSSGQLVTGESFPVLGADGPIQLNRDNAGPLSVSSTGEVSQGSELRGKLMVMDVADPRLLTQIGGGYFIPQKGGVIKAQVVPSLRDGYLEGSNTSTMREMANMITASRGFEANSKVIQIQDDRLNRTIADLGNPT
jgi:flagellar basal body rod protein FlgG